MEVKRVMIVAGGTAGHLSPALALGKWLSCRYCDVCFITDVRGEKFLKDFPYFVIQVSSPTGGALRIVRALWLLLKAVRYTRRLLKTQASQRVVCFGSYTSVPVGIAAWCQKIPLLLHEQNSYWGRANRVLRPFSSVMAVSFPAKGKRRGVICTGMPIGEKVLLSRGERKMQEGSSIVITSGTLGSNIFSYHLPHAIAMSVRLKGIKNLCVYHQCTKEGVEMLEEIYSTLKIQAKVAAWMEDLPFKMSRADLVISRCGASTLWEIAFLGVPAILVPLHSSLDNHQLGNGQFFQQKKAAILLQEKELSLDGWVTALLKLLPPSIGKSYGKAMKELGNEQATENLGQLVLGKL